MKLSERIQSCIDDGFRVPVEWPAAAKMLENEVERLTAALADKALVLERYAALRDQNEALSEELSEAREVAREVASGTMHQVDRERYFAQWTAQARAEAEKAVNWLLVEREKARKETRSC